MTTTGTPWSRAASMADSTFARLPEGYVMGSLPVKYSFWTSITKSARFGFSVIKLIVGQHGRWGPPDPARLDHAQMTCGTNAATRRECSAAAPTIKTSRAIREGAD